MEIVLMVSLLGFVMAAVLYRREQRYWIALKHIYIMEDICRKRDTDQN